MSYPVLTARQASKIAQILLAADEDDRLNLNLSEDEYVLVRDGDDYQREKTEEVSAKLRTEWETLEASIKPFTKDDLFLMEAVFSAKIHDGLAHLRIDHLEDEGFWRYLALFPFRWYLLAREGQNLKPQNFGGIRERVDEDDSGDSFSSESPFVNQVMYRAYVIGQAMRDVSNTENEYGRANAIPRGGPVIDFWHSHVLRVQIGRIGEVPRALVDAVATEQDNQMKDVGRELAKAITRLKSNVLLDVYDKKLLDDLFAVLK